MVLSFTDVFSSPNDQTVENQHKYNQCLENPQNQKSGILNGEEIFNNVVNENIVITPFNMNQLKGPMYDFTLASSYYRQRFSFSYCLMKCISELFTYILIEYNVMSIPFILFYDNIYAWKIAGGVFLFYLLVFFSRELPMLTNNIWSKSSQQNYVKEHALPARKYRHSPTLFDYWTGQIISKNDIEIKDDDLIIWVHPGYTYLGLTNEIIGSFDPTIVMQMNARSSIGRCALSVCKCANSGHNFVGRWTLEIQLMSPVCVPLIVGRRYGAITFHKTNPSSSDITTSTPKSQFSQHVAATLDESMNFVLPRLWND